MENNDDEKKFNDVIGSLKNLAQVNAPENFEANLMRRINSENFKEERIGFWREILMPSKLIPTAAVAALLVFMFIVKFNGTGANDPLTAQPRLREDVVASNSSIAAIDETVENQLKKDATEIGRNSLSQNGKASGFLTRAEIKNGLNFRLANITKSQRQEVVELKQKFELMVKNAQN